MLFIKEALIYFVTIYNIKTLKFVIICTNFVASTFKKITRAFVNCGREAFSVACKSINTFKLEGYAADYIFWLQEI
jgi:hypothetical protein